MNKGENGFKKILSIIGIIMVMIFFFSINPFVQIGAGERGVVMNWGQVQNAILTEGLHLRVPLMQSVQKISVRVQKSDVKTSGASKDLQDVGLELVVNWKINPSKVNKVYQTIGDERAVLENIIIPAVSEMAKAASARKTAEEIITKRQELKKDIDELLVSRLANYGIILSDVSIIDIKFSDEFNKAIEAKQVAEQEAKQAIFKAEQAKNDAVARVNMAEGQAKAQQLQQQALSPELLQKMAIDKWDGHFPTYMGGTLPFLQIK
jgi:regulator of protease activity HflC (stomatin/prohibitin superfamily)